MLHTTFRRTNTFQIMRYWRRPQRGCWHNQDFCDATSCLSVKKKSVLFDVSEYRRKLFTKHGVIIYLACMNHSQWTNAHRQRDRSDYIQLHNTNPLHHFQLTQSCGVGDWWMNRVMVHVGQYAAARLLGLRVRIPCGGMDVCLTWMLCVVSAKGRSLVQRSPTKCVCVCHWVWSGATVTLYNYGG